jgi:hypothetical protein
MTRLRWTTRSTRNLAAELGRQGRAVSHDTVARLLAEDLHYSLQADTKTIEGRQHPDRDAQLRCVNDQVAGHVGNGQPVISVDTKKKELVGAFKNGGRCWRPRGEPVPVSVHDLADKQVGKAVPYGIYDVAANTGWVSVGTDHDTAAFAAGTIRRWWNSIGRRAYPAATRLLVCADGGGSNGYRTRVWKRELATLAVDIGLAITVCHLPPGTQCRCLRAASTSP